MEKRRVFKIGIIERNMFLVALNSILLSRKERGEDCVFIATLMINIDKAQNQKIYLTDEEYQLVGVRLHFACERNR